MISFYDWFNARVRDAARRHQIPNRDRASLNMKRLGLVTERRCREWRDASHNKADPFAYNVAKAAYREGVADPEDYSAKSRT